MEGRISAKDAVFVCCPGLAGPGQSSPNRAAERGEGAASVLRQQRRGEDPGRRQIQAERGPEGDPGRDVRPEVLGLREEGVSAGHSGARGAGRGQSLSTFTLVFLNPRYVFPKYEGETWL